VRRLSHRGDRRVHLTLPEWTSFVVENLSRLYVRALDLLHRNQINRYRFRKEPRRTQIDHLSASRLGLFQGEITLIAFPSTSSSTASFPLFFRSLVLRMFIKSLRSCSGVYCSIVSYPNFRIIRSIRLFTLTLKWPLVSWDHTMRLGINFSSRCSMTSLGNVTTATLMKPIADLAISRLFDVRKTSIVEIRSAITSSERSSKESARS